MCGEISRRELYIAVLDIVYDTFGDIKNALARIRARMIDPSQGQRSSNEFNIPLDRAILAF